MAEKVRFTPSINRDVYEQARAAVAVLTGRVPEARTLNGLIEDALRRQVERLQRAHNHGDPFPPVPRGGMPGSGGLRV